MGRWIRPSFRGEMLDREVGHAPKRRDERDARDHYAPVSLVDTRGVQGEAPPPVQRPSREVGVVPAQHDREARGPEELVQVLLSPRTRGPSSYVRSVTFGPGDLRQAFVVRSDERIRPGNGEFPAGETRVGEVG